MICGQEGGLPEREPRKREASGPFRGHLAAASRRPCRRTRVMVPGSSEPDMPCSTGKSLVFARHGGAGGPPAASKGSVRKLRQATQDVPAAPRNDGDLIGTGRRADAIFTLTCSGWGGNCVP